MKNSDEDQKVKIVIKGKYVHSGSGIGFHGTDSWSFGNDNAENIVIFYVNNSSSSHVDSHENIFSVLDEGPTDEINGSFDTAEQNLVFILETQGQKFA